MSDEEKLELHHLCASGKQISRKIRKANISLQADRGFSDDEIKNSMGFRNHPGLISHAQRLHRAGATWTAELLAEYMAHLGVVEVISPESVRLILKKNDLKASNCV